MVLQWPFFSSNSSMAYLGIKVTWIKIDVIVATKYKSPSPPLFSEYSENTNNMWLERLPPNVTYGTHNP